MPAIAIDPSDFGSTTQRESFDIGSFSRDFIEALVEGSENQEKEEIDLNRDTNYMFMGDIGDGWSIKTPLEVEIQETEDGTTLISDNEFGFYGEGQDFMEARNDYLTALKTHYKIYKDHLDDNEDPLTSRQFNYIKKFINAPDSL